MKGRMVLEELATALGERPYSMPQAERDAVLLSGLNQLTTLHGGACQQYRRILDGAWGGIKIADAVEQVPFLPVSLFKSQRLASIPDSEVRMTLTSSGTTGQAVSQILLDAETSSLQQRALANSLAHVLGRQRLPMLIIDTNAVFKDPKLMSARGAGVLGMMRFGRDHTFALDEELQPNINAVLGFLQAHGNKPFLVFGFTFMVWLRFYEAFKDANLDLSHGLLIHSGGWKKMAERAVDNNAFRSALGNSFGLSRVYNFYGMVEQIGSIFLEGPDGLLYPPNFADVIIRNPESWEPAEQGQLGVIQVLSLLPHSYPGHSVLTEDLGVIEAIDSGLGGWMGKGIRVLGRVASAELRGCSDVIAAAA